MVKVGRHRPGGRALALVHVPDAVRVLEGDDGLIGAGNPIAWMIVSLALAAPGRGQVAAPRRGPSARTLLFSLVVAEPLALEPPLRRPSSSTRSATAVC